MRWSLVSSPRARASWLVRICLPVLVLGACSRLPTHQALQAAGEPTRPALLAGVHGPLSAAQSRAVLARLEQGGVPTDIFDRHLAIEDALVGSPMSTGNRVQLLRDGPATYRAMLDAIEQARDNINMETYILDDDAVGQRFALALLAKQRQGVQVHLMHDSLGTLGTPETFFNTLSDAGVRVLAFNPLNPALAGADWQINRRNHRKLLVVDGETAFLGGINISSVYSGSAFSRTSRTSPASRASGNMRGAANGWRDTDLQLQGPVVADLQKLFLNGWASQNGPPVADRRYFPPPRAMGREVVRAIGSSPEEPFSLIYATLLSAIASAQTSVHLTHAYFAPDPLLLAELEAAAQRGVAVVLILPANTDSWLVFHAGRSHYARLLRAGVQLHERRDVVLHAKTALVDGVWSTVGSSNLDWRSFLHNHELNAVVLGKDFGDQMQAMFEDDLAASNPVRLDAWEDRSTLSRLKEWLARLWEYWL